MKSYSKPHPTKNPYHKLGWSLGFKLYLLYGSAIGLSLFSMGIYFLFKPDRDISLGLLLFGGGGIFFGLHAIAFNSSLLHLFTNRLPCCDKKNKNDSHNL